MSNEKEICNIIDNINLLLPVGMLILGFIFGRFVPSWADKKKAKEFSYETYKKDKTQLELLQSDFNTNLLEICSKIKNNDISSKDYDLFSNKGHKFFSHTKTICIGLDNFCKEEKDDLIEEIKELVEEGIIDKFYRISNIVRQKLGIRKVDIKIERYKKIFKVLNY